LQTENLVTVSRGDAFFTTPRAGAGAPPAAALSVVAGDRAFAGTQARFALQCADGSARLLVAEGEVTAFSSSHQQPGQALVTVRPGDLPPPGALAAPPSPRVPHVLDWTHDLMAAAAPQLVPASPYDGGALVAVDANGQEAKLSLRKYHVDVHLEDGF